MIGAHRAHRSAACRFLPRLPWAPRALVLAAALFALLPLGRPASAQMNMPMMGPSQGPPPRKSAPAPVDPNAPQTHAASGASDLSQLGTGEATLPADPLAMPPELRKRIGTDWQHDLEKGKGPTITRSWYGLYYQEQSNQYRFRTVFPFWLERTQPQSDRASLFGMIYYNRRSPKHDADVLFPLFWNLHDGDQHTTAVGPFVHREAPGENDNWLAPLYFFGSRPNGGYAHIPPLLTFSHYSDKGGFFLVGPTFCFYSGKAGCSLSRADDVDMGFAPLFFAGRNERSRYELVVPLLHYYHYNEIEDSALNVWGPLVWTESENTSSFNVVPFFWHTWGKNEDHVTVFPFFHYGYEGTSNLLVTPLFVLARGENGESTFASPLYARYRGRTKLDMVTPLFWHYSDPDIFLTRNILFPFYYGESSPRGNDFALFPFYGKFHREGLSDTTFVTPFVQYSHGITGWDFNIHPLLYLGRTYDSTHTVLAPFFWDFASNKGRSTVGFPVFWRFADQDTMSELVLNTYYHQRKLATGTEWEVHVIPFFSYGETPQGHWWNVLFGLAGYTHEGTMAKVRALWVPIKLSD